MLDREELYNRYITPFRLVEELDLACGYEKSFKLVERHLLRNRYLLGIEKSSLDRQKLSTICRQMSMPQEFVDLLFDNLAYANLVLLGFEEGVEDCTYRIYLEYWDRIRSEISAGRPPQEPVTMFQGFKWNTLDNRQAVLTDYLYHPLLEVDQVIERIGKLSAAGADDTVFEVTREIIYGAAELANNEPFIYLEASEGGNPRNSFDINLYPAGLTLESVRAPLARLFRYYAIPERDLDILCGQVGTRPLGHLSGGTDRTGKDFFTVYYENQPERQTSR